MTTYLNWIKAHVLLAFSALFLIACGGGDTTTPAGSSAAPPSASAAALTVLTGTQTYSLAYGATQIGIDQRSVTATFAADNGLNAYYAGVNEALTTGTLQISEMSSSSRLQIGRWHSGQFGGVYFSLVPASTSFVLNAQQGWAYAMGIPAATVVCTGIDTYVQTAATALFQADGAIALGSINTLTATVTYNSSVSPSFQVSGEYTMNGSTANFGFTQQGQVGAAMMYRLTGTDSSTRSITLIGVFAGSNAEEMGYVLNANAGPSATTYRGAARLARTSSTRSCP